MLLKWGLNKIHTASPSQNTENKRFYIFLPKISHFSLEVMCPGKVEILMVTYDGPIFSLGWKFAEKYKEHWNIVMEHKFFLLTQNFIKMKNKIIGRKVINKLIHCNLSCSKLNKIPRSYVRGRTSLSNWFDVSKTLRSLLNQLIILLLWFVFCSIDFNNFFVFSRKIGFGL